MKLQGKFLRTLQEGGKYFRGWLEYIEVCPNCCASILDANTTYAQLQNYEYVGDKKVVKSYSITCENCKSKSIYNHSRMAAKHNEPYTIESPAPEPAPEPAPAQEEKAEKIFMLFADAQVKFVLRRSCQILPDEAWDRIKGLKGKLPNSQWGGKVSGSSRWVRGQTEKIILEHIANKYRISGERLSALGLQRLGKEIFGSTHNLTQMQDMSKRVFGLGVKRSHAHTAQLNPETSENYLNEARDWYLNMRDFQKVKMKKLKNM